MRDEQLKEDFLMDGEQGVLAWVFQTQSKKSAALENKREG